MGTNGVETIFGTVPLIEKDNGDLGSCVFRLGNTHESPIPVS